MGPPELLLLCVVKHFIIHAFGLQTIQTEVAIIIIIWKGPDKTVQTPYLNRK